MTPTKVEFVYEPFADTEEYRLVNCGLIRIWIGFLVERGNHGVDRLLDISTGVGTMAELFLDNVPVH